MYRGTGRTWRPVLGPLAGSELVFRVAADVNWVRVADLLGDVADNTLLTGLLSVLATSSSALGGASLLAQLLLYFVFIYAFVPELLPDGFGEWTTDPKFRFLTTVTVFVPYLSLAVETPLLSRAVDFEVFVVAGITYFILFEVRQSDPFEEPDGAVFRILDTAIGADEKEHAPANSLVSAEGFTIRPDAAGVRPLVARVMAAVVACGLLAIFAVFLGVLAYVVSLFFPVPELLILGWSGYTGLAERIPRLPNPDSSPDVEKHVYETMTAAFAAPFKGLATTLYLIFGFFTSAIPFLAFVAVVSALSLSEIRDLFATLARGGPAFVMIFSLFAYGSYGLWYWWQTSRRVPAFLASVAGEDAEASVTRPVWLTVPPVALLATGTAILLTGALYLHAHPSLNVWPVWLTVVGGLAYVPGLALMAVAVVRTRKTDPQTPDTENRKLPMAATVQVVVVVFASFSVSNYEAIKRAGLAAYANGLTLMLKFVVLGGLSLLLLFYLPEITERANETDGLEATALKAGPAFVFGILGGGLLMARGNPSMALVAFIVFVLAGSFQVYLSERQ